MKYKAELLGNTEADGANGILKNATIAVLLKHLSNFCKSFEMSFFKQIKHCVLSAAGNDNINDTDNILFNIKDTKLHMFL